MQIDTLLSLLREEFALDVPATRAAAAQWCANPKDPAPAIQLADFLNRSMQASEVMGLHGFAGYLQQVHEFVASHRATADSQMLVWLQGWLEPALGYLVAPATPKAVNDIVKFLASCPQPPDMQAVATLAELLAVAPALPTEDDPAQNPLPAATVQDVSLDLENVDMGLLSALLADSPEQLDKLAGLLDKLVAGHAAEADLNEAQRIAHTFKGSGNIVGLPGIGRMAHRAEDILEFALERVQTGGLINPQMARDTRVAVDVLATMVAHLMGEEAAPLQALPVLQRLLDWAQLIRQGESDGAALEPLAMVAAAPVDISAEPGKPILGASAGSDAASLRVGVDRLSRLLRRAGQSIIHAERLGQLMRTTNERLQAVENNHEKLNTRLRELETAVTRQVVHLQAQEQTGLTMDPLEMDRYDSLYTLSRFISEAAQDELELTRQARTQTERALTMMRDEGYALREQHRELLDARLIPVRSITARLRRNVAQTASSTGKDVAINIVGEQVTLDADVLTRLTEPLLHLLRNAVDHGIETSDERELMGKPAQGLITLTFARVGQEVDVICADDGAGLDLLTIYNKAVEYRLIEPGMVLPDEEIIRLILRPGFSTKGEVTEVSGRGVGMDVVADRVAGLKGRLEIVSQPYRGSQFTIRVPVSSGTAQALLVKVQDELIALTSEQVITALAAGEAVLEPADAFGETAGHPASESRHVHYKGTRYRAYSLGSWLGFEDSATALDSNRQMVLAKGLLGPIALWVDAVVEARELILQDIGSLSRRIPGVVGGSLRSDGKPLFLLDVPELERATKASVRINASSSLRQRLQVKRTAVMVVDDALSVRRSMQQLLEDAGYDVQAAMDGFDAIEKMRTKPPAIVLTDLEMPNLNGLDLTRRLREIEQFMTTPVVMITSRATDKHRNMALEAGVNVYLTKPYSDADLLDHVRALVAGR